MAIQLHAGTLRRLLKPLHPNPRHLEHEMRYPHPTRHRLKLETLNLKPPRPIRRRLKHETLDPVRHCLKQETSNLKLLHPIRCPLEREMLNIIPLLAMLPNHHLDFLL